MSYLNLKDPAFQKQVTLQECYAIMYEFVVQYNARGESSTVALMSDIGISDNGESSDPAQVHDFARVAGGLLNSEELINLTNQD